MIRKNSPDPVSIKKIYLNIWTLKDEIKSVLGQKLKEQKGSLKKKESKKIQEEYFYKGPPERDESGLTLIEGGKESEKKSKPVTVTQRTSTTLPKENVAKGMCLLSEVGMNDLYFFTNESYLEGQSIVLEFLIPQKFIVNAEVSYCRVFNMKSRIIGGHKLPFRVAAKFTFLKEGERTLLRQFVQSVEPEIPLSLVPSPKQEGEADGEENENQEEADL